MTFVRSRPGRPTRSWACATLVKNVQIAVDFSESHVPPDSELVAIVRKFTQNLTEFFIFFSKKESGIFQELIGSFLSNNTSRSSRSNTPIAQKHINIWHIASVLGILSIHILSCYVGFRFKPSLLSKGYYLRYCHEDSSWYKSTFSMFPFQLNPHATGKSQVHLHTSQAQATLQQIICRTIAHIQSRLAEIYVFAKYFGVVV